MRCDKKIVFLFVLFYMTIRNGVKSFGTQSNTILNSLKSFTKDSTKCFGQSDVSIDEMLSSIQLAMKHSLKCSKYEQLRDLLVPDFVKVEAVSFPSRGSVTHETPSHTFQEFTFKSYAPVIFQYFRETFNISCTDYETSCCNSPIRQLSNPGVSGSKMFLSRDDKIFMKTVQYNESKFLQKLFPGYYLNLNQNQKTLLPKFFGLYRYQYTPRGRWSNLSIRIKKKNIRLVTMNNILPTNIHIHQKYDLKGSTHKREASTEETSKKLPTYKDLDFIKFHPKGFHLEPHIHAALLNTLERDCKVLESFEIMDYSLLIGVHYKSGDDIKVTEQSGYAFDNAKSLIKGIPATSGAGEKVLLFVGIIDILQSYGFRKKLEYSYKAINHDGRSISVQRPEFYAIRFMKFMIDNVFHVDIINPEHTLAQTVSSLGLCSNGYPFYMDNVCAINSDVANDGTNKKLEIQRKGDNIEITYKKVNTNQIMHSIQMGIKHTLECRATEIKCDLIIPDFVTIAAKGFPRRGTVQTPPHALPSFTFKSYAPVAFHYFRRKFGFQNEDYEKSVCSSPLRELSNPGASGSLFYLSQDGKFIMKTVQIKESRFLQKLLPGYYMNLNQNQNTLLPKFFGLYRYQCNINNYWTNVVTRKNKRNIRLVAMNNLFPTNIKLHEKYDLKGSTLNRKASEKERSKSSPTYKDLDFLARYPKGFFLEEKTRSDLFHILERDCRVLESFKIMDYSLLLGVFNIDRSFRDKKEKNESISFDDVDNEYSQTGGIAAKNSSGEKLLLFVGIIDILQTYQIAKKTEHYFKAMIYQGDTVSVTKHDYYATRFLNFLYTSVFKIDKPSRQYINVEDK